MNGPHYWCYCLCRVMLLPSKTHVRSSLTSLLYLMRIAVESSANLRDNDLNIISITEIQQTERVEE